MSADAVLPTATMTIRIDADAVAALAYLRARTGLSEDEIVEAAVLRYSEAEGRAELAERGVT